MGEDETDIIILVYISVRISINSSDFSIILQAGTFVYKDSTRIAKNFTGFLKVLPAASHVLLLRSRLSMRIYTILYPVTRQDGGTKKSPALF